MSSSFVQNNSPLSVLKILQGATDFLKKQAVAQPRLHAEHLLAHVLRIPRLELYLRFEQPLTEIELEPFRELLRKRSKGLPLQHLLGSVEFCGRNFYSDARALIPRPETEQLLERALTHKNAQHILDVGTGSGVLAITLALEKSNASINAIDFSLEALALAQKNAAHHDITRITWHHGDLCEPLSQQNERPLFDLMVANLPYIATEEIPTLDREVQHDPIMALDGGQDGLRLIERLIAEAHEYLLPEGVLLLEIGKDQTEATMNCLKKNHYRDIIALPDYQGILRFVEARK